MAKGVHSKSAEMDKERCLDIPLDLVKLKPVLCPDDPSSNACAQILASIKRLGVKKYLPCGSTRVGDLRVLGRGWAGVVFAGLTEEGEIVAVKALHTRSRRKSALREAVLWYAAGVANVAPNVLAISDKAFSYKLIDGVPLLSYEPRGCRELRFLVAKLLWKAHILDKIWIRHNELARPHKQVIVERGTAEPYIIDYDSATISECPSNITQLLGGLFSLRQVRECINHLHPAENPDVRELLRRYKDTCSSEPLKTLLEHVLRGD
ncbi:MAG: hypothetical protein ABWW70_01245 [Thermoproteota archaeon]